jgi:hypothetical protein
MTLSTVSAASRLNVHLCGRFSKADQKGGRSRPDHPQVAGVTLVAPNESQRDTERYAADRQTVQALIQDA